MSSNEAQINYGFQRFFRKILINFASRSFLLNGKKRAILFKLAGINISKPLTCYIGRDVLFDDIYPQNIYIGERTYITSGTKIITHYIDTSRTDLFMFTGKIVIGSNVFIGMNTLIVKPVVIGDNSIIAAGSVLTKDVPPNVIIGGNPAKIIKQRC